MKRKTIIFLGDGMGDEPITELDNKTPIQYANTPGMDSIAKDGANGTMLTLPSRFPTSSEVANMSILGCDLGSEYCGRGPLEAAGRGIQLSLGDKAFRLNLTSVEDGKLTDFSGGHIDTQEAKSLIDILNQHFGNDDVKFYNGVSYRNILVLSGSKYSHNITAEKPDDNQGNMISEHLPKANDKDSEYTAELLRTLMNDAGKFLETSQYNITRKKQGKPQTNGVWPWSGGEAGALKTLQEKYTISSAVISAVDVINGLGKCLDMDVITVEGATGYIDTNYEGKAEAAIDALHDHDFVFLHIEGIDEVSHEMNLKKKIQAIEDFDSKIITPVLNSFGSELTAVILPDHPVPVTLGKHTRTPVPVSVRKQGLIPDNVSNFDEISCKSGSLGNMKGSDLMDLLFKS